MRFSILSLATALFLFLFSPTLSLAQTQTVTVALPDTFLTETQSVLIPVTISDVTDLGIISFDIAVSFDSTVIDVEEVILANSLAEGYILSNLDLPDKTFIAAAGVAPLTGAGPLLYLQISFLQDGLSEMNFDNVSFEVNSVSVVSQNGRLRNVSLESADSPTSTIEAIFVTTFPNPFQQGTTLSLDLPEAAQVSVEVYDVTGQRIFSYPPRFITAGANQLIPIKASSLPAGSYFYRVKAQSAGTERVNSGVMIKIH